MSTSRNDLTLTHHADGLTVGVPLVVMGVGTVYAATLGYLERRLPVKPDHIWAEVAGGVLITLVPVAVMARKAPSLDWRVYEEAIWRSFIASGVPIIMWQIGEAIFRQLELLRYTTGRELKDREMYADDTTSLAARGGERAHGGCSSC